MENHAGDHLDNLDRIDIYLATVADLTEYLVIIEKAMPAGVVYQILFKQVQTWSLM